MKTPTPEHERVRQIESIEGLTFVKWHTSYTNNRSKAVVQCTTCGHERPVTISNLLTHGKRCPSCANRKSYTECEYIQRVNDSRLATFVRWDSVYTNAHSKMVCRCPIGHEWITNLNRVLHCRSGCPTCANNIRFSPEDRECQINAMESVKFVRWLTPYRNHRSKVLVICDNGHEWKPSIGSLINQGTRCPTCAVSGYRPELRGTLYALESDCSRYMKVGISNDYQSRIRILRSSTPFEFSLYGVTSREDGGAIRDMEKTIHDVFESSGLRGFDGCTEWLVNSHELRDYLSNIMTRG